MSLSRLYQYSPFVTRFRIDDELSVDYWFWIADFGFKVFCLFD